MKMVEPLSYEVVKVITPRLSASIGSDPVKKNPGNKGFLDLVKIYQKLITRVKK